MDLSDFDFDLPPGLIAQEPPPRREDARLLVLPRDGGDVSHRGVADLPDLLRAGDLLVVNDTRVLPARLHGHRATGGRVEFLLLPDGDPSALPSCPALVKTGGSLRDGEEVALDLGGALRVVERLGPGRFRVAPAAPEVEGLMAILDRAGRMPLPPYIRRSDHDARDAADRERYQTVFARAPGAVAAPTAGLHLTDALLTRLAERGIERAAVTLHVGLGTFRPITAERLEEHEMHAEWFDVPQATVDAIERTHARGGRVVAVGTTTVRTLETAGADTADGLPRAGAGESRLFIVPGYRFRVIDALLTNFHLPRSTLICLVAALAGRERVLAAYREAVKRGYRFYSYGDAMLIAGPAANLPG